MNNKFVLEIVWWVITAIVTVITLVPILNKITNYPFLGQHILFVVAFITLTRYIFLLEHTFLAKQQYLKAGIILVSAIIIFILVGQINYFQTWMDEQGKDAIVGHLPYNERDGMFNYTRNILLFFGVGSVLSALILPFRLGISIWRWRNLGEV